MHLPCINSSKRKWRFCLRIFVEFTVSVVRTLQCIKISTNYWRKANFTRSRWLKTLLSWLSLGDPVLWSCKCSGMSFNVRLRKCNIFFVGIIQVIVIIAFFMRERERGGLLYKFTHIHRLQVKSSSLSLSPSIYQFVYEISILISVYGCLSFISLFLYVCAHAYTD